MEKVYLGLGGNIGDTRVVISRAIQAISDINGVENVRCSPLFETEPVSPIPQRNYFNGVCELETTLGIEELWAELESIEKKLGKMPKTKEAPRVIDIDLLLYGERAYEKGGLVVPHPRMLERAFVLAPLLELTDSIHLPGQGDASVKYLLDSIYPLAGV